MTDGQTVRYAIVIPAYRPSSALLDLIAALSEQSGPPIILIDDGSGPASADIFLRAAAWPAVHLLRHATNLGKGAALKTGFMLRLGRISRPDRRRDRRCGRAAPSGRYRARGRRLLARMATAWCWVPARFRRACRCAAASATCSRGRIMHVAAGPENQRHPDRPARHSGGVCCRSCCNWNPTATSSNWRC